MELQDIDLRDLIERETGKRFNRDGYINCPFHADKTPSLSVKFHADKNKDKFKCFGGCDSSGDAIDFIMQLRGLDYVKAREYLGIPLEKTEKEKLEEKVRRYIDWELTKFREGQELAGLFTFVTAKNEIAYFKAKFKKPDGEKCISYYSLKGDEIVAKRLSDELPYNYYKALEANKSDKAIVVVEGEKDVNTINSMLRKDGYEAVSFKSVKEIKPFKNSIIYICGDTGKAGEEYKWHAYNALKDGARILKFINLPGLKGMGDNKDVTDWIELGHTKKDLLDAFSRSLDVKSKLELQHGQNGIYKTVIKEKGDTTTEYKKYITNFKLKEAKRITFADEEIEGVKLVLKSPTGQEIERVGPATVFDDMKSFKNFLGTIDLAFQGGIEDLTTFKAWINKYFALESEELHQGIKFLKKNEDIILVTNEGAISKNQIIDTIKADGRNNVELLEVDQVTKEELKEINKYLFKFATPEKTLSIIGTVINNLAMVQNIELRQKLHHLLIVGESGSGKSTILENVIAPLLNYPPKDIRSIGLISPFALIKTLSDGNYPVLFEEFKPSSLDRYKLLKISECFRNLYDRNTVSRGDKSFKSKDFQLSRPMILVGEESYPNAEQALIERSCIVYLAKKEREKKHSEAMDWIRDNEELLKKLGRSLIQTVLELPVEEYKNIRENVQKEINGLNNRVLNTAINIATGIEIFNILCRKLEVKEIKKYMPHIVKNLEIEVLEGGADTSSIVERMLLLYNDMIDDGRATSSDVVKFRNDGIFIRTSEMINQIQEHVLRVGADLVPLKLRDFKKQAQKAGYLVGVSDKPIKINGIKVVRYDTYSLDMLRKLKVYSIVQPELTDVTLEEKGKAPF